MFYIMSRTTLSHCDFVYALVLPMSYSSCVDGSRDQTFNIGDVSWRLLAASEFQPSLEDGNPLRSFI